MSKQEIIDQTVQLLEQLPEDKAAEILDFAAFVAQRVISKPQYPTEETDKELRTDLTTIVAHSTSYAFLHDEPDLYS